VVTLIDDGLPFTAESREKEVVAMDTLIQILLGFLVNTAITAGPGLVSEGVTWISDRVAISSAANRPVVEPALFFEVMGRDTE
jgi:hypothetical protein